jgi:hypothetical protein
VPGHHLDAKGVQKAEAAKSEERGCKTCAGNANQPHPKPKAPIRLPALKIQVSAPTTFVPCEKTAARLILTPFPATKVHPVENDREADWLSTQQLDVILRMYSRQNGVENEANLNWCTALDYNYFAVSLFDRAEGGKKTSCRISTVNTEDSGTTGLHWFLNVYSTRCDEVPAVNEQ